MLAGLSASSIASASLILWQPPATVTDTSDILTSGVLIAAVSAYNASQGGTTEVSGVMFSGTSGTQITITGSIGTHVQAINTGDSNYNTLLTYGYHTAVDSSSTITLSGLTIGDTYRVQLWVPVWDLTWPTTFNTVTGGTTTSVDMGNSTSVARFTSGTFTADDISQSITFLGSGDTEYGLVAAVSLYASAVPEPSTYVAMVGFFALGIAGFRRSVRSGS